MNAAELLSSKGVSMQQASDWVQARLDRPGEIFSICLEFGIKRKSQFPELSPM